MGTLTANAISSTYKSLIFTDKTGTGVGDIWYTLDNGDDQKLTTLTTALTFTGISTFSAGIKIAASQFIKDANANEMLAFSAAGSAVNYARFHNSAAGNTVKLDTRGDDTNVDLTFECKGSGGVVSTPLLTATAGVKLGNNIIYNSEGTATLTLDTDEDLTIAGDLQVSGGIIEGPTDGDLNIKSDGQIQLYLDNDNDETSQAIKVFNNAGVSSIAELDESGNLQIDGSITVGSNIIKASDGGSTITMDTSDNVTIAGALTAGGHVTFAADTDLIWDTQLDIKNTTDGIAYFSFNESTTSITIPSTIMLDNDGGQTINPVIQTASSKTLDKFDSGRIIAVDTTSNDVSVTLPAASAGLNFKFMITKKGSQDLEIISPSATNYFYGGVVHLDTDAGSGGDEVVSVVSDYNSNDYLTLTLADVGTVVEMVCNGTLWYVSGTVNSATAPAFGDASGL